MAGTLFGLPLSQRVDLNGLPSVGWLLYIYAANTSTPVNSYQDVGLTTLNAWPLEADASGMMREFWLADGSYRARATNSDGSITYFDKVNVLAIGTSPGSVPSGSVDPNAIFATGDVMWLDRSGAKTGWVRDNGRSIGSATSGADERANADCQALFEFLWNNFSDTICPVITGRGGTSIIDWNANKKITLPDKRGCLAMGADQMGSVSSGRFASVPVVSGAIDTVGSVVGENTHVLVTGELATHTHTANVTDPQHAHSFSYSSGSHTAGGIADVLHPMVTSGGTTTVNVTTVATGVTVANDNAGSGTAHNVTQRAIIGTFYRKL